MCKVSVIVPVYNTERYLRACLECLAAQTLEGIEVLVVDDGSTDGSLAIAREFEALYPAIFHVYSTENRGVSHARNYGDARSRGDYLAFVDSDDMVEPDYCRAMYEKAVRDGNDVVMCRVDHVKKSGTGTKSITYTATFWEEDNFRFAEHPELLARMSTGPWNKLVKRELFFRIQFAEDIRYREDHLYVLKLFCLAGNIGVVKEILYHYFTFRVSVTSRFGPGRLDMPIMMEYTLRFMQENNLMEIYQPYFDVFFIRSFTSLNKRVLAKEDDMWRIRMQFVLRMTAMMRRRFPHWRKSSCFQALLRSCSQDDFYRTYRAWHLLALIFVSRFYPPVSTNLC